MSLITKELYHGSDLKLNTLKPTAYNAGHRLKKDSWSVFMWPTYDLAYRWAVFVAIKNAVRGHKHIIRPMGYHERVRFNEYKTHLFMNGKYEKEIKDICIDKKFYVYIIDCPIDLKFNVGNNNVQPEYTYDGELKIKKRIEFTITEEVIDETINMLPEDEYHNSRAIHKCKNIRGPLGLIFYNLNDIVDKWSYVYMKLDLKEIKLGDDLEEIMKNYNEEERNKLKKRFKEKYQVKKEFNMKKDNNEMNELLDILEEASALKDDSQDTEDINFEKEPITRDSVINKKSRIPKELRSEYADELVAYHKWARRSHENE